ncbi:motility associated factor glycosyltransferase family protein [Cohnella faecalis]|uniref:DUF115 domain-containing protein n=1 Tax=Cohnella faecalis TaxID=2315694 RepID=A0A398CI80_9BACL|nr:6-hydroxymethylpterin diphosphokinase MptE-like protein [Cohnella faecalis]RIE02065.1 DUF115 domain-containing protein [Cohnella faecalis]
MTTYSSNIQFLTDYNQWLIDMMEHVDYGHIEAGYVGDEVVFKLADEQGNEFYTASAYNPQYEAEQFLDGVNFDNTGYILMGMGSSAIVKKILENKTEAAWVLIIEKDTALVKKFLEEVDLSPYLQGKLQRIIILTELMGDISVVLNTYISSMIGYYFLQTEVLRTFASYRRDSQFYVEMTESLINHLRTHMTAMGNSLEDTLMGMTNELKNVPISLKSNRLTELKDKYQGKPAILVASGPSLDKQIPLLKAVKGKALIICAESAFRVLLKNDISPDIVCILERGTNSYDLSVKGVEIPEDTALMGLTLMDARIPRHWNSFVVPVFKENIVHSHQMNQALGNLGALYNGNSVAHLNYSLAQYLGCSPIVFIGQDLAYSDDGVTHSKHSFYVDESDEDISVAQRKQIQSSLQEDKDFFNRTVYLDGYYGGKVKSRELWRQFLHWMEHLVRVMPASLVINATEGGADIPGTVKMPFAEVVEQYCNDPIVTIPELFSQLSPIPADDEIKESFAGMVDFFNEHLGVMEGIIQFADEVLDSLKQLQGELADNPDGNIQLLDMKAGRVLRNVERLLKDILGDPLSNFFFRPLVSNYHVKMNPISRVSSIDRLQVILKNQSFLLTRIIAGKKQVFEVYEKGIRESARELGYDDDEFMLNTKTKWEIPDWELEEEV